MAMRSSGTGGGGARDGSGGGGEPGAQFDLQHYAAFRRRLHADLSAARQERDALAAEERAFWDLEANIGMLQREQLSSLRTLVPLGAGVHTQAAVADTSRLLVNVGLVFHPELTLDEALRAAGLRRQHLRERIEFQAAEVARILAHLRLVEQALSDLAALQQAGGE